MKDLEKRVSALERSDPERVAFGLVTLENGEDLATAIKARGWRQKPAFLLVIRTAHE
jgi:hypothetical protein